MRCCVFSTYIYIYIRTYMWAIHKMIYIKNPKPLLVRAHIRNKSQAIAGLGDQNSLVRILQCCCLQNGFISCNHVRCIMVGVFCVYILKEFYLHMYIFITIYSTYAILYSKQSRDKFANKHNNTIRTWLAISFYILVHSCIH